MGEVRYGIDAGSTAIHEANRTNKSTFSIEALLSLRTHIPAASTVEKILRGINTHSIANAQAILTADGATSLHAEFAWFAGSTAHAAVGWIRFNIYTKLAALLQLRLAG